MARTQPAMPHFTIQDDEELVEPTWERLTHANDNFVRTTDGAIRMSDSPVNRLRNAGKISDIQLGAAERYHQDWYDAGLAPLGAIDYAKVNVDGSKPTGVSDRRMSAAERYNVATNALGRYKRVVGLVVLLEQTVERAGRDMGFGNAAQARVVALDRLVGGLDILAVKYGLARPSR